MYELKEMKEMRSYFNGLVGNRDKYQIRFSKLENGDLLSVMIIDGFTVYYTVKSIDQNVEASFSNCVVAFSDFYDNLGKIKGIKAMDMCFNDGLYLITEETSYLLVSTQIQTRAFGGDKIAVVNADAFTATMLLGNATAKSGVSDFDTNVAIRIHENEMYANSYTKGLYVGNKLVIEDGKDCSFNLAYENLSLLKKWLQYANNPKKIKGDDLTLSLYSHFLQIKIDQISLIVNVVLEDKIASKYEALTKFEYPEKERIKFGMVRDIVSVANKEKAKDADFESIFGHATSIYRPLVSDIIYQLSDLDGQMTTSIVASKNDIIQIKAELPFLDCKILLFFKRTASDIV